MTAQLEKDAFELKPASYMKGETMRVKIKPICAARASAFAVTSALYDRNICRNWKNEALTEKIVN
jgi:hypothetical protein